MIRKIIEIDQALCNGCGACAAACHEGAIGMVNGKARLLRDDYCDGLGDCLPACPTGAISFVEREAAAYDQAAVERAKTGAGTAAGGCPGSRARALRQDKTPAAAGPASSMLSQWPVQLQLVPVAAPWWNGCDLLVAADCSAYAYGAFHRDFIQGHQVVIACPKLDDAPYAEKLEAILRQNEIRSVTVTRMEVPCCGGLERAVRAALSGCGKPIPLRVVTLSDEGEILRDVSQAEAAVH